MKTLNYKLDAEGLTLTEFTKSGEASFEGTLSRIHIPFGELSDLIEAITMKSTVPVAIKIQAVGHLEY